MITTKRLQELLTQCTPDAVLSPSVGIAGFEWNCDQFTRSHDEVPAGPDIINGCKGIPCPYLLTSSRNNA
jgi:hypothetical protein